MRPDTHKCANASSRHVNARIETKSPSHRRAECDLNRSSLRGRKHRRLGGARPLVRMAASQ